MAHLSEMMSGANPFFLFLFCFHFSPPYDYDSRHHHPSFRHARFLLRNKINNLLFQFSSFQRKSQFSCICPPFFIVTYFHAVRLVECGVCAVSIPCSCACGYPVLILIDEPSPTMLDSDADRVSRPGCLLISRGVQ
ncbi:hypothetical protein FOYG_07783 [Fusarium oxysporum NRRL 32931]|uniref:Uncharacterized protein n=1 Tax=Fusarium oxysporum NRRL 32931 TaxID=660029 RepID=W9IA56_FUSOX|nr:hypothetical protein FOYG_07783 [Fusarium oxysporum NRRL 32931]EWY90176.1 hypothetical protein FOYG_07783 [Fusarium oxysporum NRRL 32931]